MVELVFPAAPHTTVAVAHRDAVFPVRRIYCVGRNYLAHAREMGADTREPPFFFQKPADAIVASGSTIAWPPATRNLHHEVELVLAIGRPGFAIAAPDARQHVFGVAVGIDLTRRDLQEAAKKARQPWESGKSFDASAPVGAIHPLEAAEPLPGKGRITLSVNDVVRRHLSWHNLQVVMLAADAEGLRAELLSSEPSTIVYDGEKPDELLAEDRIVGAYDLGLTPERIRITSVDDVFAS